MTITLETIKDQQAKLAAMIEQFEASAGSVSYFFPETEISLHSGEHYAGMIIGKNGEPSHHLILLPGEKEDIKWQDATSWAATIGGELPTRREQSLLYANLKEQFQEVWYWSSEQYGSDYAWYQDFSYGGQSGYHRNGTLRARAVRRLVIE